MIRRWLARRLRARRLRQAERSIRALPFREGAGMERRLAYALAHREPLYLTPTERQELRKVRLAGTQFDPFSWGIVGRFDGVGVVASARHAEIQERESRTVDDHGGHPQGLRTLLDNID